MVGVEEWMVPWVAQGERVLRHRFPNWLGEMVAVSRMSAGSLGAGIRNLEECVRTAGEGEGREAFGAEAEASGKEALATDAAADNSSGGTQ